MNPYRWVLAFHIVFVVTWFAGLFYLPRLFVYHAIAEDEPSLRRFEVMERKLFVIMTIGLVLAAGFGVTLWVMNPALLSTGWFPVKLGAVLLLIIYHGYCLALIGEFARGECHRSHVWFRWYNEVPTLALIIIVVLAVVKPF